MNRFRFFALLAAAAIFVMAGCTDNSRPAASTSTADASATAASLQVNVPRGQAGELRTGFGVITTASNSRPATADASGRVEVNSTLVAITIDENGIITRTGFDVAQTRVDFNNQGQIVTDLTAPIMSKTELGEGYGMRRASGIGREYFEQAGALAAWAVGRTPADFVGMALADGRAADADLTASVTVGVEDYLIAMQRATTTLQSAAAPANFRTGLGVVTTIADSTPASASGDGRIEVYSTVAVLTIDENNVIRTAHLDAIQSRVGINASGQIVGSVNAPIPTKIELGDAYNMRRASPIGREWNEQAEALAQWVIGKTVSEVLGMSLNEEYRPAVSDLTASVTIHVDGFLEAIAKAAANAR